MKTCLNEIVFLVYDEFHSQISCWVVDEDVKFSCCIIELETEEKIRTRYCSFLTFDFDPHYLCFNIYPINKQVA